MGEEEKMRWRAAGLAKERWEKAQGEITYSDADFTFPYTHKHNEFMVASQLLFFLTRSFMLLAVSV